VESSPERANGGKAEAGEGARFLGRIHRKKKKPLSGKDNRGG